MEAFDVARDLGADGVELDVRRTADGALAVHHDAHLPDGRAIVDLAATELPRWVPSLADALAACDGMWVNVEIKNNLGDPDWDEHARIVDAVVDVLRDHPTAGFLVSSFDLSTVDRVRALDPTMPTGLLVFDLASFPDAPEVAVAHGHTALNPWDPFVTEELVARSHALGLAVNTWTVDDPDRMRELVSMQVDGIITNTPDVLRGVVDSA